MIDYFYNAQEGSDQIKDTWQAALAVLPPVQNLVAQRDAEDTSDAKDELTAAFNGMNTASMYEGRVRLGVRVRMHMRLRVLPLVQNLIPKTSSPPSSMVCLRVCTGPARGNFIFLVLERLLFECFCAFVFCLVFFFLLFSFFFSVCLFLLLFSPPNVSNVSNVSPLLYITAADKALKDLIGYLPLLPPLPAKVTDLLEAADNMSAYSNQLQETHAQIKETAGVCIITHAFTNRHNMSMHTHEATDNMSMHTHEATDNMSSYANQLQDSCAQIKEAAGIACHTHAYSPIDTRIDPHPHAHKHTLINFVIYLLHTHAHKQALTCQHIHR